MDRGGCVSQGCHKLSGVLCCSHTVTICNIYTKLNATIDINISGLLDFKEYYQRWQKYESVIAHEVKCGPVLSIFLYVWRTSDVQTTLIFITIRQESSAFSAFNQQPILWGKNKRAGSPDVFISMNATGRSCNMLLVLLIIFLM